jgi:hypothetical protein
MPKSFSACPTEIVEAPIEVVWTLLTNFASWGSFYDVRVIDVDPPGPAIVRQKMTGESGPRWLHLGVSFEFISIDEARHRLEIAVRLPLGLAVHENLDCVPLSADRCRVNYHCNFAFPGGWRGVLFRFVLRSELTRGPADSIGRLKRAAESAYRESQSSAPKNLPVA